MMKEAESGVMYFTDGGRDHEPESSRIQKRQRNEFSLKASKRNVAFSNL